MIEDKCRLCDASLVHEFSLEILTHHNVKYFKCEKCLSLQTEFPYWLEEAYDEKNPSMLDTGAAQRNLHNLAACFSISKIFKVVNVLDIGGGDGLLCRLLRDHNINCFVKDKFILPTYSNGFSDQNFDTPDLITAFEVLEHFANPKLDLNELFNLNPNNLLFSTGIYSNQGSDWWYLSPEGRGRHVFFYSKTALQFIAEKYNYSLIISGGFIFFTKETNMLKSFLTRIMLSGKICRIMKAVVMLLPTKGIWNDYQIQLKKSRN